MMKLMSLLSILYLIKPLTCLAAIYGENSLREVAEIEDQLKKSQSQSVAAVFRYFTDMDSTISRIGNSRTLHHRMVCEDQAFYEQPIDAIATAFLISSRHVMTVGHAITSRETCQNGIFFAFNYEWNEQTNSINPITDSDIYRCKDIIEFSYTGIDYAIVELDREVEDRAPLELDFQSEVLASEPIYMIGHAMQLPKKISTGHMLGIHSENQNYYVAAIDSFRGNSGSPVFSSQTNKVIGILKGGDSDFVIDEDRFCNQFKICPENGEGCLGESITRLNRL
jgi:V8-like Glu-specific endopeptidase